MQNNSEYSILIVDDETVVVESLKAIMLKYGFSVAGSCDNAGDTLVFVEKNHVDLIFIDIRLKGSVNGIELASQIKNVIPIIFISGQIDQDELKEIIKQPGYGFIKKPFDFYTIIITINQVMNIFENERKIIENEYKYRNLFEHMSDAFVYLKYYRDGDEYNYFIIECNKKFCELILKPRDQIINQNIITLLPELDTYKPDWRSVRKKVAGKDNNLSYKLNLKELKLWLKINIYSPFDNCIAIIITDISEEKKHELRLISKEKKFRAIFKYSHDGIILLENDNLIDCNDSALKLLNYKNQSDVLGRSLFEFISDENNELKLEMYKRLEEVRTKGISRFFWKIKASDDSIKECDVILNKIEELSKEKILIEATIRDVSLLKDIEKNLNENVQFFSTLINTIPAPVYYKNTKGEYLGCNEYFSNFILGINKQDIIGKKIEDFAGRISELDINRSIIKDKFLLDNPGVHVYEEEATCADGVVRRYIYNKATFTGLNDEVSGIIGVMIDISDQKKIEENLTRTHKQINSILSSIDSILIGVSLRDTITHWNSEAEHIIKIKSKDAIGLRLTDLPIDWEMGKICEGIANSIIEEKPINLDDIILNDLEGEKILGIRINPITGDEGKLGGFLIYGRDITEKKIMEMQLLQDQKLKSMGELAAGIAHEINTPTQYINDNTLFFKDSFNDLIEMNYIYKDIVRLCNRNDEINLLVDKIEKKEKEIDYEYLVQEIPLAIEQTLNGLKNVSRIVKSMKSFAHPDKDVKVNHNINKAIGDTVAITKNEWKYYSDVKFKFDENLPEVQCYPAEINQVFLNLIVNAANAIEESVKNKIIEKGIIEISTLTKDDIVEVRIKDNGIGIPENIRRKVFDPFFTTKEVGKGTGQGLAIAHSIIVEKHKGRLFFKSDVGKGTTFIIELPIR